MTYSLHLAVRDYFQPVSLASPQDEQNPSCLQPVNALLVRSSDWTKGSLTLQLADLQLPFPFWRLLHRKNRQLEFLVAFFMSHLTK